MNISLIDLQNAADSLDKFTPKGLQQIVIMESTFQREGQGVLLLSPKDYKEWLEKNPDVKLNNTQS